MIRIEGSDRASNRKENAKCIIKLNNPITLIVLKTIEVDTV